MRVAAVKCVTLPVAAVAPRIRCQVYTRTPGFALTGSTGDISPPRERKKVDANNGRNYKWTAQQIHDLRLEIDTLKAKLKVRSLTVAMNLADRQPGYAENARLGRP